MLRAVLAAVAALAVGARVSRPAALGVHTHLDVGVVAGAKSGRRAAAGGAAARSARQGVLGEVDVRGAPGGAHDAAVRYCVGLAEASWGAAVRVVVAFEDLGDPLILGTGQPSRNWEIDGVIMPVGLAKVVEGRDLNGGSGGDLYYDVFIRLNVQTEWYTGTDAATPGGMFDLVTVCLHEAYHGLLMAGSNIEVAYNATAGEYVGGYADARKTGRFDAFMANHEPCSIRGYAARPSALGAVFTSNNLYLADGARNAFAKLHSPRPFVAGSSLYHLSESRYGVGADANDLMTPVISMSYARHDVGDIVREIQAKMADLDFEPGAAECAAIGDPVVGADEVLSDAAPLGGLLQNPFDADGFRISIGSFQMNGWIFIGICVGGVLAVALAVVAAVVVGKSRGSANDQARARERRAPAQKVASPRGGNEGLLV